MTPHPGILAGVTGADLCISWSGRMPEMLLLSNSTAQALAALVLMIGVTNLFNRLNVTTRQVAGAGW